MIKHQAVTPAMVKAAEETHMPFGDMQAAIEAALSEMPHVNIQRIAMALHAADALLMGIDLRSLSAESLEAAGRHKSAIARGWDEIEQFKEVENELD